MANYIPENSEKVIRALLTACKAENPLVSFRVYDTETLVAKSEDVEKIINAIDGGDEQIGINCYDKNRDCIGWFGVLPYEEDTESIIYDHSDNMFCNAVARRL